ISTGSRPTYSPINVHPSGNFAHLSLLASFVPHIRKRLGLLLLYVYAEPVRGYTIIRLNRKSIFRSKVVYTSCTVICFAGSGSERFFTNLYIKVSEPVLTPLNIFCPLKVAECAFPSFWIPVVALTPQISQSRRP